MIVPVGMLTVHERFRELLSSSTPHIVNLSSHDIDDLVVRTCFVRDVTSQQHEQATSLTLAASTTEQITIPGQVRATAADALFGQNQESINIVHAVADCLVKVRGRGVNGVLVSCHVMSCDVM